MLGNIFRHDLAGWKYLLLKYNPAGEQLWAVTDTTPGELHATVLATDNEYNVYITGYGNYNEQSFVLTQKYDSSGALVWSDNYVMHSIFEPVFIEADNSGNCYVSFNPTGEDGYSDAYLVKYNSSGDIEWTQITQSGNNMNEQAAGMAMSVNNICIGINTGTDPNPNEQSVKYYNPSGNMEWERNYKFGINDRLLNITADKEGNIYCLGEYTDSLFAEHIIAYKIDMKGVKKGEFDTLKDNYAPVMLITDSAGNIYVSCIFSEPGNYTYFKIIKLNPNGSFAWEQTITTAAGGYANIADMECDNSGNIYLADNVMRFIHQYASRESEIFKLNEEGSMEWTYNNGSTISDVAVSPNDNVYIAGSNVTTSGHFPGIINYRWDINTEKIIQCPGNAGNLKTQNQEAQSANSTDVLSSIKIIPNPNDGNMQVVYELPENETGKFEMYDVLGKKIYSNNLYTGKNSFVITGENIDKGIYFYQATTSNGVIASDKIIVIK
ncbi:MAG: T9SS type A sorting domain-containing protein [Bacteroidota bacterium]